MASRDQEVIVLEDFKGLWARSSPSFYSGGLFYDVPLDHFQTCTNLAFFSKYVKQREGYAAVPLPFSSANASAIRRLWIFPKDGDASLHFIILSGGNIYDSASPTPTVPILQNIGGNDDISVVILFNRVYVTIHDRQSGKSGL